MKKSLKIILIVLIVLSLAIALTGCGKKEENNTANTVEEVNNNNASTNTTVKDNTKSKTYNTFSSIKDDYVISLEGKEDMGEGEENVTMTVAAKGENSYVDLKATSQHVTVIYKDNTTYVISHDQKMYMVQEGKAEDSFEDMSLLTAEELKEMETKEYTTGKETIDGTEYEYEEYKDEEENTIERFYFLGAELRYVKDIAEDGTEQLMKVNNISSDVDDSLFEIPTDYQKVEF